MRNPGRTTFSDTGKTWSVPGFAVAGFVDAMRFAVVVLLIANALLFAYAQLGRTTGREPERLADQLNPSAIRLLTARDAAALGVAAARNAPPPRSESAPDAAASDAAGSDTARSGAASSGTGDSGAPTVGGAAPAALPTPVPDRTPPSPGGVSRAAGGSAQACLEWGPFSDTERARAETDVRALALTAPPARRPVHLTDAWWVNVGAIAARAAAEQRLASLQSKAVDDVSVVDYGASNFTVSLGVYRTEAAAAARAHALAARGVTDVRVEPWKQPITLTMLVVRDPAKSVVAQFAALQARYAGTELKAIACPAQP